jgi:hypothetical protein
MGMFDCNLFVLRTFLRHMYPWARLAMSCWLFVSQEVYIIWLSYLLTMRGWLLQEHGRVHSIRYLRIIFFIALWDHIIIYLPDVQIDYICVDNIRMMSVYNLVHKFSYQYLSLSYVIKKRTMPRFHSCVHILMIHCLNKYSSRLLPNVKIWIWYDLK